MQVDSISRVERAHHLTLGARLDGYRPALLDRLAFEKRALFEHWTHDAALIPIALLPALEAALRELRGARAAQALVPRAARRRPRSARSRACTAASRREGPLRARDFERGADRPATGWWDWTPEKMALEFLWRTGRLAIAGRDGFHKVYDLIERVLPDAHAAPAPEPEAHVEWACSSALERLGVATADELAAFWRRDPGRARRGLVSRCGVGRTASCRCRCTASTARSRARAFALPDWETRAAPRASPCPSAPACSRRSIRCCATAQRVERLFGFDYRFEAFVPAAKRRYGYYVLPILERERFVGRLDPRHDRERGVLVVERLHWEPGVRPTRARLRALDDALADLAARIGANSVERPPSMRARREAAARTDARLGSRALRSRAS